ncbi:conserved Plasmodium membrane protein, unknown function [Plasmodium gallinaceum]|uniref:Uncharacterized protein n=1 Tax=Plasmodium gallinaceum TaxID=5849 RepID=A0A1J1GQ82_PLAGA|nr:conserved Plasmodium membrane protein, unknown function [Plasmodium gallinaceum]CRG94576.1 conserved Plasmodium membrane protein, unknown function [Plasmodium gallinaceum]
MNDNNLNNLIQKIGHHIDDIRDRSIIMLIQKYEKNLIDETDIKKRDYFFYIILHYINDRNSYISLKSLMNIFSFIHSIIKKDEEIKKKFEEIDIIKYMNEFLTHFKNNEEKYKSNNHNINPDVKNDFQNDNIYIKNYEKSLIEDSDKEYNKIITILYELINLYYGKKEEFLKSNSNKNSPIQKEKFCYEKNKDSNEDLNNNTNHLNENYSIKHDGTNVKKKEYFKESNFTNISDQLCENDLNSEHIETRNTNNIKQSILNICKSDLNLKNKEYMKNENPEYLEKKKKTLNSDNNSLCKNENSLCNKTALSNNSDHIILEKDRINLNQIIKKNNCINIFTKNNCVKSSEFEYYNTLYCIKSKINEKSKYLLLKYKKNKVNKKKEYNAYNNYVTPISACNDNNNINYKCILNNYTFFYLFNFFDCFDIFKKNFLSINDIKSKEELFEKKTIKEKDNQNIKNDTQNQEDKKKKNIKDKKKNYMDYYSIYLKNNYLFNQNFAYKIINYINKMKILIFSIKMKFNYFEILGINIIKKKISVDDLIYMNKEINKILNEYIYIFNKDILLFNYKFLYTLSYNIHYIYKSYVENNQLTNDFNHVNNIVNNLSYIIYIVVYSLYINLDKECLCNHICNIYINNFFFLISQNLFYLLLICVNKENDNIYLNNNEEKKYFLDNNNKKITQLINNINLYYYNTHMKKLQNIENKETLEIKENDIYHYLLITENNCIYFFKFIILHIFEILKNTYCKISKISQNCVTLNFQLDNFVIIYDFIYNLLIHYFNEESKQINEHLEILVDFIKVSNFYQCNNKKKKKMNSSASEDMLINELNNFSSTSSPTDDLTNNKLDSIEIFSNNIYKYTYKYTLKQIEILKIICLYINYTPISFILMKKIKKDLIDIFKMFLFDINLNTHNCEILHFFEVFFFFYDYEIYKDYNEFLLYYYSFVNLFFSDNTNQLDISTFMGINNNIFHFFFFLPINYYTLDNFLDNYYYKYIKKDNTKYDDIFFNSNNTNNTIFETFDSLSKSFTENNEYDIKDSEENYIKNLFSILIEKVGYINKNENINGYEKHNKNDNYENNNNFCSKFVENITNILIENNLKMMFNSFILLSSEYNNVSNYVNTDEKSVSMYQYIVDKLKDYNKIFVLTFDNLPENKKNTQESIKFVKLFKNFLLLLHNIISLIYNYNTTIVFFFFNFIFNINHEKPNFFKKDKKLNDNDLDTLSDFNTYNYELENTEKINHIKYNEYFEKNIHKDINLNEDIDVINYNDTYCNNIYSENIKENVNKSNKEDNNNNINENNFDNNQSENYNTYEDTYFCSKMLNQKSFKKNEEHKMNQNIFNNKIYKTDYYESINKKKLFFDKYKKEQCFTENINQIENSSNSVFNNINNHDNLEKQNYSTDIFLSSIQINEFIDIIYEICIYSKKEIKNYYIFFILENIKNNILRLFDTLKGKDIKEKGFILSKIKIYTKILLLLNYIKKKYIIVYEQSVYNSFHFLYENYFCGYFILNKKKKSIEEIVNDKIYLYQNVFLNIHNIYFYIFQKKKKRRNFSLKIFWKWYHQFKIMFSKVKIDESDKKNLNSNNDIKITNDENRNFLKNENHYKNNLYEEFYKNEINRKDRNNLDSNYHNIFKYTNDWNTNVNILNIYVSDFLTKQCIREETVIIETLSNIDINKECCLEIFNHIIVFILKKNSCFISKNMQEEQNNEVFLCIYEKVFNLYLKLLKEILIKEETKSYNIEIFIYVLKIIILLLITNYRNSNICKRIYKEKYFFLSHLYCFFFINNEVIKALCISLSFYLIFDQKVLLLEKHRIFLEPYLILEKKKDKKDFYSSLDEKKNNTWFNNVSINLKNFLIDEIKKEHIDEYVNNKESINTCVDVLKNSVLLKKYKMSFFNLNRKNKYIENDLCNFENTYENTFNIENKIVYFIPFWLYKKLQSNNFLFMIKKLKSFFFFSTKFSYLHIFHDSNINSKEKELCFYGNYNNNNMFLSFFLFINKYYYLIKNIKNIKNIQINNNYHQNTIPILKRKNIFNENTEIPIFKKITNMNSFLFLNLKMEKIYISEYNTYIRNLLSKLKLLPILNDGIEEVNFNYLYDLNKLFFILYNYYMELLYVENKFEKNKEIHSKNSEGMDNNINKLINFNKDHIKNIYYLFENDCNEIINIINFVYNNIFPYVNKLLFFIYNHLILINKENHVNKNIFIHKYILLLDQFLNVLDICLYIDLIFQKKDKEKSKINNLNKDIDLFIFIYKLLYISVATSTLKNKISIFSLNLLYNFAKLENYSLKMKYNCYNSNENINSDICENKEKKNSILLKDEEHKNKIIIEKNKNLSNLVNFLFFIISKFTKKIIKKSHKNSKSTNFYSNIINIYEIEKNLDVENVNFQHHEKDYLKLDLFFLKNIMSMLHVIMRKGCFIDIYLKNDDLLHINLDTLKKYDYKRFIDKKLEDEHTYNVNKNFEDKVIISNHEQLNNSTMIQELENDKSILDENIKDLNKFKHIFLNRYMNILINFCNIYNDIVIECLYIQLLLFFFKYILQILKAEISKEYLKNNCSSKQKILVYFLKYYKADKHICKFLKKIYLIILKYTIYMQNIKFVKDNYEYQMNRKNWETEKEDYKNKEKKNEMNKYNYLLKEDEINKNYCKLFYDYTVDKYKNCEEITDDEEYENSYKKKDNVLNSNYICMMDFYCCNCEEQKILFLSIIFFLSFFLDKFPFFFHLENNRHLSKEVNYENKKKDNIIVLCEYILHFLGKKNIYINFSILEEAKLFEKYFIKIFIKLLFCDGKETMNNLQKYEIFFYKKKSETYIQNNSKSKLYTKEENEKNNEKKNSDNSSSINTKIKKTEIEESEDTSINNIKYNYDNVDDKKNHSKKRNRNSNFYSNYTIFFTKNMMDENCFYINHFINYFLAEKKAKNYLDFIYDKIYYYILIVSMCFKDKNILSILLSNNELFYEEFNEMIQEYLKFVLNNKEEVNKKKKKNEMMIQNLLYIFVSYIYIYLNDLYNIFFKQIKNVLTLPSFFQNIIYISDTNLNIFYENNTIKMENLSINVFYESLINKKKKEWNKNLENYTDENIKNIIINNIFRNNNIYLFILYIINDNKYNLTKEKKINNSYSVFYDYEDEVKLNFKLENIHLEFRKNNKIFINKITTNIILFFLLFFYDYYSYNYEIKENILMQIARHIVEHFSSFFNVGFLNVYEKYCEIIKTINLKKKINNKPLKYGLNKNIKNFLEKDCSLKQTFMKNKKNELIEKSKTKKNSLGPIRNLKNLRTTNNLSKKMNENTKKREEILKEKKHLERINNEEENTKREERKNLELKREEVKDEIKKLEAKEQNINESIKKEELKKLKTKREEIIKNMNEEKKKYNILKNDVLKNKNEFNESNNEYSDLTKNGIYIITTIKERIKRNKKLLSLYTTNCFRIIQIYNNISSLIFKYKYIIYLLQKFSHFTNKNIVECIYNSFNFYLNNHFKAEMKYLNEKNIVHFDKEIGYFSYIYINYFFNFLCCFIIYDISALYKFCCNTFKCIEIINNYFKDLLLSEKGIYICIIILNFYLIIINSYFFDFSFYENTLCLIEEENKQTNDKLNIRNHITNYLKNKKNNKEEEVTYFICIKKLSNEFNKSKFFLYLINYVINNLDNNINKTKIEIENKNNLIILILQLLSYTIIFIDNKNEILKLANVLIKYLKKNDDILISYYITVFFNSCFINSFFDERLINLLFNFDKKDNLWFNLIFLSNNKMKKNKEVLVLIKFSILHMYLLLLKNKNSFKKCILYISSDINIYFVLIYILNEIFENFKNLNNEENMSNKLNMKELNVEKSDTNKRNYKKYFYTYVELLIIVTEIIKILNNNDVNKYITLQHNKDKDNLSIQFKNLYKKIKHELKHLGELIKLINYTIFLHPLMINIHILHKFYLCIYIKEFYYFHKTFFNYNLFLIDYLHLIKNKRKRKMSISNLAEGKEDSILDVSVEKNWEKNNLNNENKKQNNIFNYDSKEKIYKKENIEKNKIQNWENSIQEPYSFYFFFNTPKHYNFQINNLCSSTLQNEFHYSLTKIFSSFFCDQNKNYVNNLQYNNDQIKMYVDYVYDNINFALDFFNDF